MPYASLSLQTPMHMLFGVLTQRCCCAQAYSDKASLLPTGSLMDGALTPVNSPAVTLHRRHQPAAVAAQSSSNPHRLLQSGNVSQSWESAMQQPVAAQPKASKSSMQEMDSLLAAEKVCIFKSRKPTVPSYQHSGFR